MASEKEFEWGIALKINAFYYIFTGTIASLYLTHSEFKNLNHILILPSYLGLALGVYFCIVNSFVYREDKEEIRKNHSRERKITVRTSESMIIFLSISSGLFLLTALLTGFFYCQTLYSNSQVINSTANLDNPSKQCFEKEKSSDSHIEKSLPINNLKKVSIK